MIVELKRADRSIRRILVLFRRIDCTIQIADVMLIYRLMNLASIAEQGMKKIRKTSAKHFRRPEKLILVPTMFVNLHRVSLQGCDERHDDSPRSDCIHAFHVCYLWVFGLQDRAGGARK